MRAKRQLLACLIAAALLSGCERGTPYTVIERPAQPVTGAAFDAPLRMANRDIARDFVSLVFYPENSTPLTGLVRFDEPVDIRLASPGLTDFAGDLEQLLGRIRARAGIDIRQTRDESSSDIDIILAPKSEMNRIFPGAQCFIVPERIRWSQFLRRIGQGRVPEWSSLQSLTGASIFIPASSTPREIRECFEEEVAQALGPSNDLFHLSNSVFNDDNVHTSLTSFDTLILRILYDPRLERGMTQRKARVAAMQVLRDVNPAGQRFSGLGRRPARAWDATIQALFRETGGINKQRQILQKALQQAERIPKPDHRLAYTLDLLASLEFKDRPELSEGLLERALESLRRGYPANDLRVATLQLYLAQTKLRLEKPQAALDLVRTALPSLAAHDTTLRIAHALQIESSALGMLGARDEAVQIGIDSLKWARYAQGGDFGNLSALQRRLEQTQTRVPGGS